MSPSETVKFFAQLVHAGLLEAVDAKSALESSDPVQHLIASGVVTPEVWRDWVDTNAGTRPKLSRYELHELLGEGGEARVFRATDKIGGAQVALKILRPALSRETAVVQRFVAEAKLLQQLECDHIVKGLRVAREGQTVFSAMEVIEGESLQERLDSSGPLDEDEALDVVRQIALALAHLHERSLVHRDVKPSNILVTESGRAVLIDLGFAVARGRERQGSESTAGTVHYIAPEQARGSAELDVRADIYSLGATLYHLLTGSLPFSGATSEEVMAKQVLEALSGSEIRSMDLSPQVHYLIEKMMAKEKSIRYQDPRRLAADIEALLAQRRRDAELRRPATPPRPTDRARRRRRR